MTFTNEQLQILSKWEYNFTCAVKADWSPNPGETNAKLIHQIYRDATGDQRKVCYNCQHSLLSLMRDCGRLYLQDKDELAKSAKAVEVSQEHAEPVKKVEVKTKDIKKVAKKTKK